METADSRNLDLGAFRYAGSCSTAIGIAHRNCIHVSALLKTLCAPNFITENRSPPGELQLSFFPFSPLYSPLRSKIAARSSSNKLLPPLHVDPCSSCCPVRTHPTCFVQNGQKRRHVTTNGSTSDGSIHVSMSSSPQAVCCDFVPINNSTRSRTRTVIRFHYSLRFTDT